jgi:hypothetical protein
MSADGSITRWIGQLHAGDQTAAQPLWEHYFQQLVELAHRKLHGARHRVADEEDVALSAFDSFCRGLKRGRFPDLRDRDNLWKLLVVLTARKACHLLRDQQRLKRGGDVATGADGELEMVASQEPTPEFAAEVADNCQRLLYPSPMKYVAEARLMEDAWIDIEKPFWWDVAVWLASGQMNSMGLANNHMCRDRMYENEAWGKPRPVERLPAPLGNGYWTQEIYYHVLNAGLRVPPSAGSASGVLPNPVGYNRVYVHVSPSLTHAKSWEGLRAGRSFVTNGPLLRVEANGKLPGHVFTAEAGQHVSVDLKAAITTNDSVGFVEIIKNGQLERKVALQEWSKTGSLGSIMFKESGWFLVRTIADNKKTFRFASSAPFFVEIGPTKRRISKASVRFFLDWTRERKERIKLDDPAQRTEVLAHHVRAERFWLERLKEANSE